MLRFVCRTSESVSKEQLAPLLPYSGIIAGLLYSRGIRNAAEADRFLHPSLTMLHDPMLLSDMEKAVDILDNAKKNGIPTVVFGDYDVDGMCAATLLTLALRRFGLKADHYTPLRESGYGLNEEAITRLAQSYRLLITVDLGITNCEEIGLAKSLGMTVIVSDHHALPPTALPQADAILNPLLNEYPFPKLCGTGVAFKIACALLGGAEKCREFLDLAALATVADVVPLTGENRIIVAEGMKLFRTTPRLGLKELMLTTGRTPDEFATVDTDFLAFQLAPRLNAAGRLDDANKGVRLLMTEDPTEAGELAAELNALNQNRKATEQQLLNAAELKVSTHDFVAEKALVICGENWHPGVVGLVAGKLCEKYHCPACVLSDQGDFLVGSLRSVPGVNIHQCLVGCADLLTRYGGHKQAAGVTLPKQNFDAFNERLQAEVAKADPACFVPEQEYDAVAELSDCSLALVDELSDLAPYGFENLAPLFLARRVFAAEKRAVGANGSHLKLKLSQKGVMMDAIAFSKGNLANTLPNYVDVVFSLEANTFRGKTTPQMNILQIEPVEGEAQRQYGSRSPEEVQNGLISSLNDAYAWRNQKKKAGNSSADIEYTKDAKPDAERLRLAVKQLERGHLVVARSPQTLASFALPNELDVQQTLPTDLRCFPTLLTDARISMIHGFWRHVWLLDGETFEGEAEAWHKALPMAEIHAFPSSDAIRREARNANPGRENCQKLFVALRNMNKQGSCFRSHSAIMQQLPLTYPQLRAAMTALSQLGLIEYQESPFRYSMLPTQKVDFFSSFLIRTLSAFDGTD